MLAGCQLFKRDLWPTVDVFVVLAASSSPFCLQAFSVRTCIFVEFSARKSRKNGTCRNAKCL